MNCKRILAAGLIVTMMCPAANMALANTDAGFTASMEGSSAYAESAESNSSTSDESAVSPGIDSEKQTDSEITPDHDFTKPDETLPSEDMDSNNDDSSLEEDKEPSIDTDEDAATSEEDTEKKPEDSMTESETDSDKDTEAEEPAVKENAANDEESAFSESAKEALETPVSYEIGQLVKLPDGSNLYREGYIFVGWNTDPDATEGFFEIVMQENTILYAIWIPETGSVPSVNHTDENDAEKQVEDESSEEGLPDEEIVEEESVDVTPKEETAEKESADIIPKEETAEKESANDENTENPVIEDFTEAEAPTDSTESLGKQNPVEAVKPNEDDFWDEISEA